MWPTFFVSLQAKTIPMAEKEEKKEKKKLKLNEKYVFMLSHDDHAEPMVSFKINLFKKWHRVFLHHT